MAETIDVDKHGQVVAYDEDENPIVRVPRNPAFLGFPPMLPFELAMHEQPVPDICEAYGISREDFAEMIDNEVFQKAYADAQEGLRKEGASFRIKARLQAEQLLGNVWRMIHAEDTPNSLKADMIKSVVRWAGYEPKASEGGATSLGSAFQININLGA